MFLILCYMFSSMVTKNIRNNISDPISALVAIGLTLRQSHHTNNLDEQNNLKNSVDELIAQFKEYIEEDESIPLEVVLAVTFDGVTANSIAINLLGTLLGLAVLKQEQASTSYLLQVASQKNISKILDARLILSEFFECGLVINSEGNIKLEKGIFLPSWMSHLDHASASSTCEK